MQDYGVRSFSHGPGPSGPDRASSSRTRWRTRGLGANWKARRAFWAIAQRTRARSNQSLVPADHADAPRRNDPTWSATTRISGPLNSPSSPARPGGHPERLFYDYRTNVDATLAGRPGCARGSPGSSCSGGSTICPSRLQNRSLCRDVPKRGPRPRRGPFRARSAGDEIAHLVRGFMK